MYRLISISILLTASPLYAMGGAALGVAEKFLLNHKLLLALGANDSPYTVSFLIEQGADPAATDENGSSCLHIAAQNCHADSAAKLLDKGNIKVDALDHNELTPLAITMLHGPEIARKASTIQTLLKHGANPNIRIGKNNDTPLTFAAQHCHAAVVYALVQSALLRQFARNKLGKNACDLIAERIAKLEQKQREYSICEIRSIKKEREKIVQELREATKIVDHLSEATSQYDPLTEKARERDTPYIFGISCASLTSDPLSQCPSPQRAHSSGTIKWVVKSPRPKRSANL